MSRDFGINNEGGGFAFDDDSDLDQLLEIASKGEESGEDEDDSGIFLEDSGEIAASPADTGVKTAPEPVQERYEEPVVQEPEPIVQETSYTPEPVYEEPVISAPPVQEYTPTTPSFTAHRPVIRKETDLIDEAARVIRVLDVYRKLTDDVKNVVAQFVYNDNEVDISDEATLVVKVINAEDMLGKTMTNLKESAAQKDRVERAFYILRLAEDELASLGALVSTLTETEISGIHDRIGFSKQVESAVDTLDPKIIQYVTATESVLNAAN